MIESVWTSRVNTVYSSPVRHQSKVCLVARGVLSILDAETGKRLGQIRLKDARETGGPFGSLDYASPVVVGDRLFYLNASGQMFLYQLEGDVKLLATNEITTEQELFWGSPAVSRGRMVFRSTKHLYCVAAKGKLTSDSGSARAIKPVEVGKPPANRQDMDEMGTEQSTRPERPLRPAPFR